MDVSELADQIRRVVVEHPGGPALGVLGLSAAVEYVFPPFPGDSITVLGAFLAATGALRPLEVFLATAAGSLVGSAAVYYIGRAAGFGVLYAGRNNRVLGRMLPPARVEGVLAAVRRFGPWIVAVNRFVPAVRMLFLLAAGAARVRPALALALAALSAILWNAVLFTVGYSAGTRLDLLQAAYERHRAAWALAVLAAAALALALALRRRHRAREGRA